MWNWRKSVLLPANRRKAGARPRARVTSRRELGRGERGLRKTRAGPSLPQDRQRPGSTGLEEPPLSWRAPLPRPGRCDAVPAVRALRGPSSAAPERAAPRPPVLARRPAGPAAPVLPAPSGQVQRRPGGRGAQRHGPCRGPSRRGGEKSGSRPGSAPLAPSRILALLLPRLPTGPSERACGGDPLSLPDLPCREKALWPSQRLQAAAAPHRRWNPEQLQPGSAPRAALQVRGAEGSEDLADTRSLPIGTRGRLGSAGGPVPAAVFCLILSISPPLYCLGPVLCFLQRSGCWSEGSTTFLQS